MTIWNARGRGVHSSIGCAPTGFDQGIRASEGSEGVGNVGAGEDSWVEGFREARCGARSEEETGAVLPGGGGWGGKARRGHRYRRPTEGGKREKTTLPTVIPASASHSSRPQRSWGSAPSQTP